MENTTPQKLATYTAVIVLAPIIRESPQGRLTYQEGVFNFHYLVPNDPYEFRYKAVKKLFDAGVAERFMLVGGPIRNEKNQVIVREEVEALACHIMKYTLTSKYEIPAAAMHTVSSRPNTIGNITAVSEELKARDSQYLARVGVLTNFYHLPRALRLFHEHSILRPIPICAESLLMSDEMEHEYIRKFYTEQGLPLILGQGEIQGLSDIEKGTYTPRIA